jgi:hypothetical protein
MVANFGQIRGEESSVTTYSRTATGNVAPMRRLAGPATKLGRVSGAVVTRIYADRSFNGDGRSDILWRNNVGTLAMWLMNGSAVAGTSVLGTVPLGWTIVGIGDFNGDRKADLLWRDGAGTLALWRMNGFVTLGTNILGAVATAWSVSRIADFNGDGKSDIRGGTRTGTWRSG